MFGVFLFLSLFLFRSHILHRWLIEDKHSDSGVDLPADPIVSWCKQTKLCFHSAETKAMRLKRQKNPVGRKYQRNS